ncbi:MAG TPA: proton-conducting transporter membrane subunit [Stellaceae bacterium]|nr:proton-conducting transporter membrane subunit [Stellaceae bacterium]
MANELLAAAALAWVAAGAIALTGRLPSLSRALLVLGSLAGVAAAFAGLPGGTAAVVLPPRLAGEAISFHLAPAALWLLGFGLVPAIFACGLASPVRQRHSLWLAGAALSLLGALGVFGLDNAAGLLIAWEIMTFGGALLLLAERLSATAGRSVMLMLGLLEVGAVALLVAFVLLAGAGGSLSFAGFPAAASALGTTLRLFVAVLLLIGFGAKLGLLPFYEWYAPAYTAGSGASGALLSGVVLNSAFFALGRGLLDWAPGNAPLASFGFGEFVVAAGVLSAILAALYAFQQQDWRALLSLSSAENAAIAVVALGAALVFRGDHRPLLASLAWTVALLHLAGHALAKGGLMLAADGVFGATGSYAIAHTGLLRRVPPSFGVGALFAAMSLSAMPPQAGFVSEWYLFQTLFQGFHLASLEGRLALALAGAGLALTVAIALAAFIKLFGIGLLGRAEAANGRLPAGVAAAVGLLGLAVLGLAAGMPYWLPALDLAVAREFTTAAVPAMHVGLILVPATGQPIRLAGTFAFISPSLLVVAMPLLALLPLTMLAAASRRHRVRRAPLWYGGRDHDPARASTTALSFANALRTFYSFVYRPREETERETSGHHYFVTGLAFRHEVAPVFEPHLFQPATRFVQRVADRLRLFQSGDLNFYLAAIGVVLLIVLAVATIAA